MKPVVIDNLFSEEELFYVYKDLISNRVWNVGGSPAGTGNIEYTSLKQFNTGPSFTVMDNAFEVFSQPYFLYGQSLIFRLKKILEEKNIGLHTKMTRMWFNICYSGSKQNWLHQDNETTNHQSILLFMTPVWQTAWKGSFYVGGEEYKYKPGSAIIFDSQEFHTGEAPSDATFNWIRMTANIVVTS
jgi:hypothetical protein